MIQITLLPDAKDEHGHYYPLGYAVFDGSMHIATCPDFASACTVRDEAERRKAMAERRK